MGTTYTVSDGKLMLVLEPAEEGGYIVTSPIDPQLITQAETLEEAFRMAYDAREGLIQGRAELARRLLGPQAAPSRDFAREAVDPPMPANQGLPSSVGGTHDPNLSMAPNLRSLSFDSDYDAVESED